MRVFVVDAVDFVAIGTQVSFLIYQLSSTHSTQLFSSQGVFSGCVAASSIDAVAQQYQDSSNIVCDTTPDCSNLVVNQLSDQVCSLHSHLNHNLNTKHTYPFFRLVPLEPRLELQVEVALAAFVVTGEERDEASITVETDHHHLPFSFCVSGSCLIAFIFFRRKKKKSDYAANSVLIDSEEEGGKRNHQSELYQQLTSDNPLFEHQN